MTHIKEQNESIVKFGPRNKKLESKENSKANDKHWTDIVNAHNTIQIHGPSEKWKDEGGTNAENNIDNAPYGKWFQIVLMGGVSKDFIKNDSTTGTARDYEDDDFNHINADHANWNDLNYNNSRHMHDTNSEGEKAAHNAIKEYLKDLAGKDNPALIGQGNGKIWHMNDVDKWTQLSNFLTNSQTNWV